MPYAYLTSLPTRTALQIWTHILEEITWSDVYSEISNIIMHSTLLLYE